MLIEAIGWLAAILFAIHSAPQSWQSYVQGHSVGISKWFIWLWFWGEVLMIIYVPLGPGWNWPIMTNLLANLFFVLVILKYMYYPRIDGNNNRN